MRRQRLLLILLAATLLVSSLLVSSLLVSSLLIPGGSKRTSLPAGGISPTDVPDPKVRSSARPEVDAVDAPDVPDPKELSSAYLVDPRQDGPHRPIDLQTATQIVGWLRTATVVGPAVPTPFDAPFLVLDLPTGTRWVGLVGADIFFVSPGHETLQLQAPALAAWLTQAPVAPPAPPATRMHVSNHYANIDRWIDDDFVAGHRELAQLTPLLQAAAWVDDPQLRELPIGVPGGMPAIRLWSPNQQTATVQQAYRCTNGNDAGHCTIEPDTVVINGRPARSAALVHALAVGGAGGPAPAAESGG